MFSLSLSLHHTYPSVFSLVHVYFTSLLLPAAVACPDHAVPIIAFTCYLKIPEFVSFYQCLRVHPPTFPVTVAPIWLIVSSSIKTWSHLVQQSPESVPPSFLKCTLSQLPPPWLSLPHFVAFVLPLPTVVWPP